MAQRAFDETITAMERIVRPGEFGLGNEPGSLMHTTEPTTLAQVQGTRSIEDVAPEELTELIEAHEGYIVQEKNAWERLRELITELQLLLQGPNVVCLKLTFPEHVQPDDAHTTAELICTEVLQDIAEVKSAVVDDDNWPTNVEVL